MQIPANALTLPSDSSSQSTLLSTEYHLEGCLISALRASIFPLYRMVSHCTDYQAVFSHIVKDISVIFSLLLLQIVNELAAVNELVRRLICMRPGVCLGQFLGSGIAGTERTCDFNFDAVHRGLLPEKDTSSPQPHRVRPLGIFPNLVGDMVSQYFNLHLSYNE